MRSVQRGIKSWQCLKVGLKYLITVLLEKWEVKCVCVQKIKRTTKEWKYNLYISNV